MITFEKDNIDNIEKGRYYQYFSVPTKRVYAMASASAQSTVRDSTISIRELSTRCRRGAERRVVNRDGQREMADNDSAVVGNTRYGTKQTIEGRHLMTLNIQGI